MNNETQPLDGGTFEIQGEGLSDAEIEELKRQEMKKWAEKNAQRIMDYYGQPRQPTAIPLTEEQAIQALEARGILASDTAKVHLEGGKQAGPDSYEIETPGYNPSEEAHVKSAWEALNNHPLVQAFRQEQAPPHIHGPFNCVLNANHNALRWCLTCGATWAGVMAGITETDLQWHKVQEPPEEDEL